MRHQPEGLADDTPESPSVPGEHSKSRAFRITCENLALAAVLLGVALRIWEYAELRSLYLDEACLLNNIVGRPAFDFHHVLEDDQMAPPAFLVIERILVHLPVPVRAAGRLFPLVCGIATVFFTHAAARRYLDRRAVPLAVALFAMNDHLIYYSAEIKQYSCDLMCSLIAILLAAPRPPDAISSRRLRALAVYGLIAPWFSFPVVFVLAAVGLHLIVSRLQERQWRGASGIGFVCLGWVLSFGGCYLLSRSILSQRDFIWVWWNFAFLPIPPRSLQELSLLGETLANVFIHPVGLLSPLSLPYTAAIASLLWLFGFLSLGLRWPGGLFILTAPLLLALAASGLHLYPFHGRLLIYLVPSFLLPMCEGITAIGRRIGWPCTLLLAGFFLYGQAAEIVWQKAIIPRARTFDSHGDLKNDLLDYLEYQRERAARPKPLPPNRAEPVR